MRPISIDLRKRVVAARHVDGQSMGQIAERFKMPKGTVQNILERYRDAGTVDPKPYSPDFNPSEQMWSKVKSYLRRVKACAKEELGQAVADALESITPEDAAGFFNDSVVGITK